MKGVILLVKDYPAYQSRPKKEIKSKGVVTVERPILFNTEMVQAILKGNKTQTRRAVKNLKLKVEGNYVSVYELHRKSDDVLVFGSAINDDCKQYIVNDYAPYQVSDVLWVRETFCYDDFDNGGETVYYKADFGERHIKELFTDCDMKWTPSIHMPRKAARLFLKVTNVRCERLQDITEDGAKAEGIKSYTKDGNVFKYCVSDDLWFSQKGTWQDMPRSAKEAFEKLWDSIYKSWLDNPWVWVIEFERMV